MTDSTATLLADMRAYVDGLGVDDDFLLEPRYAGRIQEVGTIPFFATVFRELQDSALTNCMFWLGFAWKDFSFDDWKSLLREICEDSSALYGFVWFVSRATAIDVGEVLRSDPKASDLGQAEFVKLFPKGGPIPSTTAWIEVLEEFGVDQHSMWRRLAAEGAPMLVNLDTE